MNTWVILPTVDGREELFRRVSEAYAKTRDDVVEIVAIRNAPTVGEAWNLGSDTIREDAEPGDLVVFGIDDAVPHDGWQEAALAGTDRWIIACPRIELPDGTLESCGTMGGGMFLPECPTGTLCRSSGIPAMRWQTVEDVGPFLDIHYYVDDEWCHRATRLGCETRVARGYAFTHWHATPRRAQMQARAQHDRAMFLDACTLEVEA